MNRKTRIAMIPIVLGAIALVGAGGAGSSRSATYDVTVDTIEGCSCPLFCTCYFGASADEHMCQANNVYKFRKGSHWGDVDLSDSILWLNADLGGEWHKNPGPGMEMAWALVTFDQKTTPVQREAIGKLLGVVFPVHWKKFSTREDSITWQDDAKGSHAKMASGLAEITLDKTSTRRPDQNAPAVIQNLQYWGSTSNGGFNLAYSTHHFNGAEGDPKFSWEKRNGFTITWTARGDVSAAAAKPAKASM